MERCAGWTSAILFSVALAALAPGAVAQDGAEAPPEEPGQGEMSPTREAIHGILTPQTVVEKLGTIVLILLLSFLAYRAVMEGMGRAIRAAEARSMNLPGAARQRGQRAVTIMSLLSNVARWVISIMALIWVLGALGINLLPVLTGVGFLGAAIAFGSQALVRDIVTGFFLLLEGQYAVGDYVELGGKFGRVEAIGLRTTLLRDLDNQLHHIPNGSIATSTVYLQHFVNYLLLVPVARLEDADRASELVQRAACETRDQLPRYLLSVGEVEMHTSPEGVSTITIPFAVLPTQNWVATTELPNRVKVVLARAEVALPEGMAPQAVADLSHMPLVPVGETPTDADTDEADVIARWRVWVGKKTAAGEEACP